MSNRKKATIRVWEPRKSVPRWNERFSGGGANRTNINSEIRRLRHAEGDHHVKRGSQYLSHGNRLPENCYVYRRPPNNQNSEDQDSSPTLKDLHGKPLQRVGLFRNAKHSDVVSCNLSEAVRKRIDATIRKLVRPEKDVEWTHGNIPGVSHCPPKSKSDIRKDVGPREYERRKDYDSYNEEVSGEELEDDHRPGRLGNVQRKSDPRRQLSYKSRDDDQREQESFQFFRRYRNPHQNVLLDSGYEPCEVDDSKQFERLESSSVPNVFDKMFPNPKNARHVEKGVRAQKRQGREVESDENEEYEHRQKTVNWGARPISRSQRRVSQVVEEQEDSESDYSFVRPQKIKPQNMEGKPAQRRFPDGYLNKNFTRKEVDRQRERGRASASFDAFVTPKAPPTRTENIETTSKKNVSPAVQQKVGSYQKDDVDEEWKDGIKWCQSRAPSYLAMVRRMNTSMPSLYLRDNSDLCYRSVALQLLSESMKHNIFDSLKLPGSPREKEIRKEKSKGNLVMDDLLNKTSTFRSGSGPIDASVVADAGGLGSNEPVAVDASGLEHRNARGEARSMEVSDVLDEQRYLEPSVVAYRHERVFGNENGQFLAANSQVNRTLSKTPELEKGFNRTISEAADRQLSVQLCEFAKVSRKMNMNNEGLKNAVAEDFIRPLRCSTPLQPEELETSQSKTARKRVVIDDSDDEEMADEIESYNKDLGWQGGGGKPSAANDLTQIIEEANNPIGWGTNEDEGVGDHLHQTDYNMNQIAFFHERIDELARPETNYDTAPVIEDYGDTVQRRYNWNFVPNQLQNFADGDRAEARIISRPTSSNPIEDVARHNWPHRRVERTAGLPSPSFLEEILHNQLDESIRRQIEADQLFKGFSTRDPEQSAMSELRRDPVMRRLMDEAAGQQQEEEEGEADEQMHYQRGFEPCRYK